MTTTQYRLMGRNNQPVSPLDFDEFAQAVEDAEARFLVMAGGSSKPLPEKQPVYTLEWARRHLEAEVGLHPELANVLWIEKVVTEHVE